MAKLALILIGLSALAVVLQDASNPQGSILSKLRGALPKEKDKS